MAEIGEEREQPKPNLWETLASAQRAQPQNNNGWNQSDKWGQPLNDDAKWKSDGWGTYSGQKEPDPLSQTWSRSSCHSSRNVRRSRSPGNDLRQLINRGANWREESPFPPHCGNNATRSQGTRLVCNNRTTVENENQLGLSSPRIKRPDQNDENRHNGQGLHSPVMTKSGSRSSSPFSQAAQEVNKSSIENKSDGWGLSSSHVERSRSRSLSPWSQAARNTKENSDRKDTDCWGEALDQIGLDAWNQTKSNDLLPNNGSNKRRDGCSAFRLRDRRFSAEGKQKRTGRDSSRSPEHNWTKIGQHPDRSICSEHSVSPENRLRRTGCGRGRYRGRGGTGSSRLGRWGLASPNVEDSRSRSVSQWSQVAQELTKNANQKESDGWGQDSSPVKQSRPVSPWSQAAVDINKNYNNKDTDGWGTTLDQTGHDAWNQPRSNLSPDRSCKRRGQELSEQSRSPAPKWRRTGWDLERPRGRDGSYSPENKQRTGWSRGGSRYRGRGRTNSPYRCQKRREKRDSSYSPIIRSRRSPILHRSPSHVPRMDQDREKRDASEGRDDKKTDYGDTAAKVTGKTGSDRWGPASPNVEDSRSRPLSQWSQVAQESTKNANQKESDGWGQDSSPVKQSRSVSPWSQAAVDINKNYNNKDTDGWGTTLDQTGHDAWNQPRSNLSPDRGFKRRGQEPSDQSRSPAPKWRRTGWDLDRPRGRDGSYSPENKQRTGWSQGGSRYRGRGRTNSPYRCQKRREKRDSSYSPIIRSRRSPFVHRSPSRVPRMDQDREKRDASEGWDDKKTNYGDTAAKVTGKTGSYRWGPASPNVEDSRSRPLSQWSQVAQELTKNANQKESDGWGQDSAPVKQSRSVSPWSQAAVDINKNYNNKDTDGWDTTLDQTGHDAWNQPRSNLSPDRSCKRRGQEPGDQSRSPAPKWRRTGWDLDRPRCRDGSYSPDNKKRTGWSRGGSRYRGRGRTNSPYRCQKRREKRDSSYSPICRSRRSPILHRSPSRVPRMDQDRENSEGSEGRDDKKTNYGDTAAKVTSWEGPKWHDWSVNALKSSLRDPNLIFNWGGLTNIGQGNESSSTRTTTLHQSSTEWAVPRVAGNTMLIPDAYCKTKQRVVVMEGTISQELQISSQYHEDVNKKVAENSPGMEHSMNPTTSQWDNDMCIASSHATGTLSVNPSASQSLSNHQNPIMVSKVGLSQTNQNSVAERFLKPNSDAVMQPISCTYTKVGTSRARGSDTDSEWSSGNPVAPTSEVPKLVRSQLNQNLVVEDGTAAGEKTDEVDNHIFKWALVGFAKPKLKPFWLKRRLKDADYRQILHKFVNNVSKSLGTRVPQTHENSCKFVKEQNDGLSKYLQMYLGRFVSEDVLKNTRYDGKNEKSMVFP